MGRKIVITFMLSILLSASYLVAAEHYDTRAHHQSNEPSQQQDQIEFLKEKINLEQIHYIEVGVALSGIVYDEKLQSVDLEKKTEEIACILEEASTYTRSYGISDSKLSKSRTSLIDTTEVATVENSGEDWRYTFSVKNQKDIHQNTYYDLKIVGGSEVEYIDQLRNRGYEQFKMWQVTPKETIYFKGFIPGALSKTDSIQIKDRLFHRLDAKETNFYQDDLIETTYAYYGYTPYIKAYIVEADGQKSNMQISFKYNELQDQTELIIAFPFYNQPF